MLHAVLEEAERAIVEVEQHAHTIALLVGAYWTVWVAIAVEDPTMRADEPAISAVLLDVLASRVERGWAC
jgi:hypothetical protein